jgi:hypothetical protein
MNGVSICAEHRATIGGAVRRSTTALARMKRRWPAMVSYRHRAVRDSVSSSPMDSVKKKLDPSAGLDQSSIYVSSY